MLKQDAFIVEFWPSYDVPIKGIDLVLSWGNKGHIAAANCTVIVHLIYIY